MPHPCLLVRPGIRMKVSGIALPKKTGLFREIRWRVFRRLIPCHRFYTRRTGTAIAKAIPLPAQGREVAIPRARARSADRTPPRLARTSCHLDHALRHRLGDPRIGLLRGMAKVDELKRVRIGQDAAQVVESAVGFQLVTPSDPRLHLAEQFPGPAVLLGFLFFERNPFRLREDDRLPDEEREEPVLASQASTNRTFPR